MKTRLLVAAGAVLVLAWLAAAANLGAHHSLSVEFDTTKTVMLVGTITEMRWTNPHSWLHIEVKAEQGPSANWAVEFASPNSLYRRGWRRDDLPAKIQVTVNAYPARDGSKTVSAIDVKLPDGRVLFAGAGPTEGGR